MHLYFMRPQDGDGAGALKSTRELLADSVGQVRAAVAYLTHLVLIQALLDRAARGAPTFLILNSQDFIRRAPGDASRLTISSRLMSLLAGAEQYWDSLKIRTLGQGSVNWSVMRHKFAVGDSAVIFGSANWTQSAFTTNYEWMARSSAPPDVSRFGAEFGLLWERAQAIHVSRGKLRRILCPVCGHAEGVDFESYGPFCTFCGHRFALTQTD